MKECVADFALEGQSAGGYALRIARRAIAGPAVDEADRSRGARPAENAFAARRGRQRHAPARAETLAVDEAALAVDAVGDQVRHREPRGFRLHHAHPARGAPDLAFTQQHREKTVVIARARHQPTAAERIGRGIEIEERKSKRLQSIMRISYTLYCFKK